MMNQSELLALFSEGKDTWNEWVDANSSAIVDFSDVAFDNDVTFKGFRFPEGTTFIGATFPGNVSFGLATFPGNVSFNGATFSAEADFSGVKFSYSAFEGATFAQAVFHGATFLDKADFNRATFSAEADFSGSIFSCHATFPCATFLGSAYFSGARFLSSATFYRAKFSSVTDFGESTFSKKAYFTESTFLDKADFHKATFSGPCVFEKTIFSGSADFRETKFSGSADFRATTISGNAYFRKAAFSESATFASIDVDGRIDFNGAQFLRIPDFHAAKNPERIALDTVEFALPTPSGLFSRCINWATGICRSNQSTIISIRQIRGIANKNHAIDTERDLTILERNAQTGAAWSGLTQLHPFKQWRESLSTAIYSTPLLLLYRWSSDYGRSVKRPLILLIASPFFWYVIYLKLYSNSKLPRSLPLDSLKLSALADIAVSGSLPVGSALRPTYIAATQTLFGGSGILPLHFQIALLLQSVTSLLLLFLIGLALRNFFRLR